MKPTNLVAWLAGGLALLVLSACGGGGGGAMAPLMPEAAPAVEPDPEPMAKPAPPASSRVEPDPAPSPADPAPEPVAVIEPDPVTDPQTLPEAARVAALAPPQIGSLHQSSARAISIEATGFKMAPAYSTDRGLGPHSSPEDRFGINGRPPYKTEHNYDETYIVDYDGDGQPEHQLNAQTNKYPTYIEKNRLGPLLTNCDQYSGGRSGSCRGMVGDRERFMLSVYRAWRDNLEWIWNRNTRLYETAPSGSNPYDATFGVWVDRKTRNMGAYWAGPSIDNPRPVEQPITGTHPVTAYGYGVNSAGDLSQVNAGGYLELNVSRSEVTLGLGQYTCQ